MGRTLPNMFALFPGASVSYSPSASDEPRSLANIALYLLLDRAPNSTRPSGTSVRWAIALLTFTTGVFRSELLLLVGPLALQAALRYTSLYDVAKVGIVSGLLSAGECAPLHFLLSVEHNVGRMRWYRGLPAPDLCELVTCGCGISLAGNR